MIGGRPTRSLWLFSPSLCLLLLSCDGAGTTPDEPDGGTCPLGCPEGLVCRDGYCVDPEDPCAGVQCRTGTRCVDGSCVAGDPCEGVICADPDAVCRDGECVPAGSDGDGDGHRALDDCDDGDPAIHPGAEERCNGEDDDCDGEVDEDLAPRPCSTDCGSGTESCVDGAWVCSAPVSCECTTPGESDSESCGRCGSRSRVCQEDLTWGPWGPCEGDVDCPVVCGDGHCDEPAEDCASCEEDCGPCCTVDGHLGTGDHGDPCEEPEQWRCVHSDLFGEWISQVCRSGIWQTFERNPVDCAACCGPSSPACEGA